MSRIRSLGPSGSQRCHTRYDERPASRVNPDRPAVSSRCSSELPSGQLQPLVLPQLGQAWQLPARIICTPQVMHIGASPIRTSSEAGEGRTTPRASVLSSGVGFSVPFSRAAANYAALVTDLGSGASSVPWEVATTDSSTPGSVGCLRSSTEKMPNSARSS